MKSRYFIIFVTLLICVNQLFAQGDPSIYNVVWNSPSKNATGTMPIGNGDIGANVYVIENGDLYLLLSKNDAFTYQGDIFKTGRVKLSIAPNPFVTGAKFKQTLDLLTGSILIEAGDVMIRVWADANTSVYHVNVDSKKDIKVNVMSDLWQRFDYCLSNHFEESDPKPTVQDVLKCDGEQIYWYYHVGDCSVYDDDLKYYDVEHMATQFADPYRFNTFGNLLESADLKRTGESLSGDGKNFDILIHSYTKQDKNVDNWISEIKNIAELYHNSPLRWESHKDWWANFWSRSWIQASNNEIPSSKRGVLYGEADQNGMRIEEDNAAIISQSYNVFRFIMACQSRGEVQAKFNGGLFTQQLIVDNRNNSKRAGEVVDTEFGRMTHEDDRLWGRRFTWQNQRLLYWPLFASGDFELFDPFYRYYDKLLPLRRAITKEWFGHDGTYFRENICPTGSERDNEASDGRIPSGAKPAKAVAGTTADYYHDMYFYSGLELVIMMLQYVEYTEDQYFAEKYLLPTAREIITFFDRHYDRDVNGKLLIDPAQVLETFWRAKNPAPEISALIRSINGLLSKNIGSEADIKSWKRLLSEIPAIPMQRIEGDKIAIAPAEEYSKKNNHENGELYPVFPAELFGVAHGNEDIVKNTMSVRTVKDGLNHSCWSQDQVDWAYAGEAKEAADGLEERFRVASTGCRFPLFGRENPDSCPDLDHFGVGSVALQRMLLQENGDKIFLLPAWPANWDVNFKLHAKKNTVIEGSIKNGKLIEWSITPKYRANDVTICEIQK